MRKVLIVVGWQPDKLDLFKKKEVQKIETFIQGNQSNYDYTISIVRVNGNRNLAFSGTDVLNDDDSDDRYSFIVNKRVEVIGYMPDIDGFDFQTEYHILGVSTAASVLGMAMALYSKGCMVRVLKKYCLDRKGKDKEAFTIMDAYMPGVLI